MESITEATLVTNHSEKQKFYFHPQAIVHAETYFEMAVTTYKHLLPLLVSDNPSPDVAWKLWPICVNLSLSCEIILKLFFEIDKGKMGHGHLLYKDLFNKLSNDSQKKISDKMLVLVNNGSSTDYTYDNFINDLKKSENTFSYERYSFEVVPGNGHGLNVAFLFSFAEALISLYKELK